MSTRTNYIFDPGIEGAISGYFSSTKTVVGTPTLARVASPYSGTYGLEYSYAAVSGDSGAYAHIHSNYSGAGTAVQNDKFTLSAMLKLGAGSNVGCAVRFKLKEYSSVPAYLAETSGTYIQASLTTSWQRFSYTFTCGNVNCDRVIGSLAVTSVDYAGGDAFDILSDEWLLEKVDTLGDYFDGATADGGGWTYDWSGTDRKSVV